MRTRSRVALALDRRAWRSDAAARAACGIRRQGSVRSVE
jgi:hypothetical protein